MLKIRNKNVVKEIAAATYKAGWKRNLFTIFSIIMTTFMVTAILAIGISYQKTIFMRSVRMHGMSYDMELTEPEEKQIQQIREMDKVANAGLSVVCAVGEKYKGKNLYELQFYWLDRTAWEKQCIPALESYEGTYPEKENEIMLSAGALRTMGVKSPKIGMKLPITWYSVAEGMAAGDSIEKEFILSGFFKDYSGWERGFVSETFYRKTGAEPTDFMQGTLMVSFKNPLLMDRGMEEIQNALSISPRQAVEGDAETAKKFMRMVIALFCLLLMVLISGYLFVYNMLLISVSRDITCYGQLNTVGMTSSQLKGVVNRHVIWNCVVGIPLGLLSGFLAVAGIVPAVLTAADTACKAEEVMTVQPQVCLPAALLSFLATWYGSRKPVRLVKNSSAIEAVRYTGSTNRRKKRSLSGSLLSMAWSNLFRSRRQAVIILASFVTSVAMVWVIRVVIQENDARQILNAIYPYDIRIINETVLDEKTKNRITQEKIEEIKRNPKVKSVGTVVSADAIVPFRENLFGEYFKNLYQSRNAPGGDFQEDMKQYKENPEESFLFTSRIIGIDSVIFNRLNANFDGSLDRKKFEDGETAIVIKNFGLDIGDAEGKELRFYISGGPGHEEQVKIAAVGGESKDFPAYFSRGYLPQVIVSRSYFEELVNKPVVELLEISYEEPFMVSVEEQVKGIFSGEDDVTFGSKLESYHDMEKSSGQIAVLGNSMCIIIILLAVINYFTMLAAGIESRRKEFTILESIGMTTKQIKKMLTLEGAGYAVISLFGALVAGILVSRLVFHNLNVYGMEYVLPWQAMLVFYLVIFFVCIMIPKVEYCRMPEEKFKV